MEVDVLNMQGEKVSTVELPAQIFEAPVNVDLMHQAYVRQMANARLGTHSTKTRGDVSGGGENRGAKRYWSGSPGFYASSAMGRRWSGAHPQSAQLHQSMPSRCAALHCARLFR